MVACLLALSLAATSPTSHTPPGAVITFSAEVTWAGGRSAGVGCGVAPNVVLRDYHPLVSHYNPLLAGVEVRWIEYGFGGDCIRSGMATNDGRVLDNGVLRPASAIWTEPPKRKIIPAITLVTFDGKQ